jgi:hypothetical protein
LFIAEVKTPKPPDGIIASPFQLADELDRIRFEYKDEALIDATEMCNVAFLMLAVNWQFKDGHVESIECQPSSNRYC